MQRTYSTQHCAWINYRKVRRDPGKINHWRAETNFCSTQGRKLWREFSLEEVKIVKRLLECVELFRNALRRSQKASFSTSKDTENAYCQKSTLGTQRIAEVGSERTQILYSCTRIHWLQMISSAPTNLGRVWPTAGISRSEVRSKTNVVSTARRARYN